MRALNNDGTEALLAAPFAFSAKLVIFHPSTLVKKERPFSLEIFRHTGHLHHLLARAGFADLLLKIENAQHLPKLFAFGAILDVFV